MMLGGISINTMAKTSFRKSLKAAVTKGAETPEHYNKPVTPWCLERHMESSGSAFVDSRRTDAIEYCFRMKGDLIGDLRKARHCLEEAIRVLEEQQ